MQTKEQSVTLETAKKLGLSDEAFNRIQELLGRMPNLVELNIYSVMWSEYCSYKSSIKWLRTLPVEGKKVLNRAGGGKAGMVDIGDGLACAFKMESLNGSNISGHLIPSVKGFGGAYRDVFAMGVRPIAALNALHFGDPKNKSTQRQVQETTKWISKYGNSLGVPIVGGETYFEDCFDKDGLVNIFSAGLVRIGEGVSGKADGAGNPVLLVGKRKNLDDSASSQSIGDEASENDQYELEIAALQEKQLMEAFLEAIQTGVIIGADNVGAAGIVHPSAEMCTKAGTGMVIHLEKVPVENTDLNEADLLFSEGHECMMLVAVRGEEGILFDIFEKWDLGCVQIGEVTDTGILDYRYFGVTVAEIPAMSLVIGGGAPVKDLASVKPKYLNQFNKFHQDKVKTPSNLVEAAKKIFASPNLVSKRWIYEQFDGTVRTNNLGTNAPCDAAGIRIKGSKKSLLLTVDGNTSYVYADPFVGGMIAVAEAARNVICAGGTPLAVTTSLHFGNPQDPEVYYQFTNAVKGIGEACRKFNTPVTSSSVNFRNLSAFNKDAETSSPTPTIGMLGILDEPSHLTTLGFKDEGDLIYMLGNLSNNLGSSEYLKVFHGIQNSPVPDFDLYEEHEIQKHIRKLIRRGIVKSAHDVSEGGVFANLMESAIVGDWGFVVETVDVFRKDAFLFSESQGRITITIAPDQEDNLQNYLINNNVSFTKLGEVFGDVAVIDGENFGHINDWKRIHQDTFSALMETD